MESQWVVAWDSLRHTAVINLPCQTWGWGAWDHLPLLPPALPAPASLTLATSVQDNQEMRTTHLAVEEAVALQVVDTLAVIRWPCQRQRRPLSSQRRRGKLVASSFPSQEQVALHLPTGQRVQVRVINPRLLQPAQLEVVWLDVVMAVARVWQSAMDVAWLKATAVDLLASSSLHHRRLAMVEPTNPT